MPERRPGRAADSPFVRAANFASALVIAAAVVVLLMPQPNHAQTGPAPDAALKVAPGKFGKSAESIAAAKAKWKARKAAREARRKAGQDGKEKQKARVERRARKSAAGKPGSDDAGRSGAKKCPPGQRLDKISRGGCL